MTRTIVYVFACGCCRKWSDGSDSDQVESVNLGGVCDSCRLAAERKRRELRALYGTTIRTLNARKKGAR